jgi:hypothetical protein
MEIAYFCKRRAIHHIIHPHILTCICFLSVEAAEYSQLTNRKTGFVGSYQLVGWSWEVIVRGFVLSPALP